MDSSRLSTAEWLPFLSSIFPAISITALGELAAQFEVLRLEAGETLIRQGESEDCGYLILSGQVRVVSEDPQAGEKTLAELGPGQPVGELALWTGDVRSATVRTLSEVRAAKLTREAFDRWAKQHPEAGEVVDALVGNRLRQNRLSSALRVSKLFGELEESALRELEAQLESFWIAAGETLFRQGESGDALYLVVSGKFQVLVDKPGEKPRVVAELGCGETIGEMALLEGEPRMGTAMAIRDSEVAKLTKEGFERLIATRHALLLVIARKLVARLRAQNVASQTNRRSATVIAVVPATAGFPLDDFCTRLAAALSARGRTLLLGSAHLDASMGKPGAAQTTEHQAGHGRVIELLATLEAEHQYIVYQPDPTDSAWNSRCLRQCDHVLIAGDAAADPGTTASSATRALSGRAGRAASLVLLHLTPTPRPSGTNAWLSATKVDQHYHVRLDSARDFARLARSLTGSAVGLVLGGGAARGLGHAGVIRAIREAGIPIDIVGGTSMGSIMGACVCLEYDYDRMLESNKGAWPKLRKDRTIPLVSFLSGYKVAEVLIGEFGNLQIEDLWMPFFCISANLTHARFEVHQRGPLVKSILASTRLPVVFPPIVWDGNLLIDGGIINNVPVDVMRGFPACGTVIASDVSPAYDPSKISDYGHGVSGWQALKERLKPVSKRRLFPGPFSVLMRTMDYGGAAYKNQIIGAADLYLAPPLARFGIAEYKSATEMAEVSYAYSVEKIAVWLASSGGAGAFACQPISYNP
jgi:lysophospholipid hydrolase